MRTFEPNTKYIVIFKNVRNVIQAERIIKEKGFPCQIVPVPSKYSSECGMCIEIEGQLLPEIDKELNNSELQYNIYQK